MLFDRLSKDSSDITSSLETTLILGFMASDYEVARGRKGLPNDIFNDLYVLGFVAGTMFGAIHSVYCKRAWATKPTKKGKFILKVCRGLGLNQRQIDLLTEQMGQQPNLGQFSDGVNAGELHLGASLNILNPDHQDQILVKARDLSRSQSSPKHETEPADLSHSIARLTIVARVRDLAKGHSVESEDTDDIIPDNRDEDSDEYLRFKELVQRNLLLIFDIDLTLEIYSPYKGDIDEFIFKRFRQNRSSLTATVSLVAALYIDPDPIIENWYHSEDHYEEDVLASLNKCLVVIEHHNLDTSEIDYQESQHVDLPKNAGFIDQVLLEIMHLQEVLIYDGFSEDEFLISTAYCQHKRLIYRARDCLIDRPKLRHQVDFVARLFRDALPLQVTIDKLNRLKGAVFTEKLCELLLLDQPLSQDEKRNLRTVINKSPHASRLNIPVMNSLLISDRERL